MILTMPTTYTPLPIAPAIPKIQSALAPALSPSAVTPVPLSPSSAVDGSGSDSDVAGPSPSVGGHPYLQMAFVGTQPALQGNSALSPASLGAANAASMVPHQPIAEFLYQLTRMLSDASNRHLIEWRSGRIYVHHPQRLADEVLHCYFRHSKYASFQRQLNYFGFHKIAGKGKMSPCSYVNDAATEDIRSLLLIRRKTNGGAAAAATRKAQVARAGRDASPQSAATDAKTVGTKRKLEEIDSAPSKSYSSSRPLPPSSWGDTPIQPRTGSPPGADGVSAAGQNHRDASLTADGPENSTPWPTTATAACETLRLPRDKFLAASPGAGGTLGIGNMSAALGGGGLAGLGGPAAMPVGSLGLGMLCPATAALNAAMMNAGGSQGVGGAGGNPYDTNLSSLLGENPSLAAAGALGSDMRLGQSHLLGGLPSSGTLFPETLSALSLSQMTAGVGAQPNPQANGGTQRRGPRQGTRVPSFLGLSGMLSPESSFVDLAASVTGGGGGGGGPAAGGAVPSIASMQRIAAGGMGGSSGAAGYEPTPLRDTETPPSALGGLGPAAAMTGAFMGMGGVGNLGR